MTMNVLISGKLIKDPTTRTGASGKPFTTASVIVADKDESFVANIIAFGDESTRLARLRSGDAVSIAGSATPSAYLKGGEPKAGLNVTASAILTAYDVRKRRGDTGAARTPAGQPGRAPAAADTDFNDTLGF